MARRNHHDNREESVAVAIDKDKGSQYALKWAVDRLLSRGQSLTLIHVKQKRKTISILYVKILPCMAKSHCFLFLKIAELGGGSSFIAGLVKQKPGNF